MRRYKLVARMLLASVFLCPSLSACAQSDQAVSPAGSAWQDPAGYAWQDFGFMKALVPDGWFTRVDEGGGTKAVFISLESIEKEGAYLTGLSVNAIKDIPSKMGMSPSGYAFGVIAEMTRRKQHRNMQAVYPGPFVGYHIEVRSQRPSGEYTILFALMLGNDVTGTAFMIIFESPEADWPEMWKIGETILDSMDIDGDY